jgi:hypothetical protein
MEQVEIKFGGKPVRVELAPSENYPEIPHKVLTVADAESGQLYMPGPEMLMIEGFYQGKLDYELYQKKKAALDGHDTTRALTQ